MFKGIITSPVAVTSGVNIPFTVAMNTNCNTKYNTDNSVDIQKVGFYDISANLVVTNVAVGNITAQAYADGVAIPEAVASATSGALTDLITLPINDMVKVIADTLADYTNISIRLSSNATVNSATFIIEKVR